MAAQLREDDTSVLNSQWVNLKGLARLEEAVMNPKEPTARLKALMSKRKAEK